jgi:hypothetical protein
MANPAFPMNDDLGNGATVKDWLGTARAAAQAAANNIEDVYNFDPNHDMAMFTSRAKLRKAQLQLQQALDEVNTIVGHIELQRIRKGN